MLLSYSWGQGLRHYCSGPSSGRAGAFGCRGTNSIKTSSVRGGGREGRRDVVGGVDDNDVALVSLEGKKGPRHTHTIAFERAIEMGSVFSYRH